MLVAWGEFLRDPESEKVRNLEFSKEEFKEAKDELIRLSQNSKERSLYELREKANKDRTSALENAEQKGRKQSLEQGEKNKTVEIAKNLLKQNLDTKMICLATGLTEEEIKNLNN